jgi:thioredoxin-dependent peroxiredoxin
MVSVDDADTNRRFAAEHEADFPILSDPERKVAASYGVLPDPATATSRARRWTFYIAPDGKILFIDKAVRTGTAGEDLVKKLGELGVKRK